MGSRNTCSLFQWAGEIKEGFRKYSILGLSEFAFCCRDKHVKNMYKHVQEQLEEERVIWLTLPCHSPFFEGNKDKNAGQESGGRIHGGRRPSGQFPIACLDHIFILSITTCQGWHYPWPQWVGPSHINH